MTHHAHHVVDELFDEHRPQLGAAAKGYGGHVHRVVELAANQVELDEPVATLLGVAGFFHDAGIWLDGTFDYLSPSIERAKEHLASTGNSGSGSEDLVEAIIGEHHRMRRAKHDSPMVEAFRRADLTDVSFGLISCPGTSRASYRSLLGRYPSAGFRRRLVVVSAKWFVRHPLRPLPMVKF